MHRILNICAALALAAVSVCGQQREVQEPQAASPPNRTHPVPSSSARQSQPPPSQQYRSAPKRIPAAQYSPLAAQGGYDRYRQSPWEAIVHKLNPWHLNLGQIWEQRRQAWLDNAATNRYFWYAFWTTGLLILSWFAMAWIQIDRVTETWDLAEDAADALRYAEYCKRQAKDAIRRHNEHVEKCNRVIEAAESGLVTPETVQLDSLKRQLDQVMADYGALNFENARLNEELSRKSSDLQAFTQRVAQAEKQIQTAAAAHASAPNAQLVERINRLEQENRQLKQRRMPNGPAPERKAPTEA
ncbi:MAG: hypothetical protein ACRD7E_22830 [Bryobacteraceae bacterium]